MVIDPKPFRGIYGAEYLYLFDGMWQREEQFENPEPFETIVLGFVNYLGSTLQSYGLPPRKLRIPPFPNFSFQIALTQEPILLILGQGASTSMRFAYYKNYSQLTPMLTLESVLAECEQNYGWDSCLGISFPVDILKNQSLKDEELRKKAESIAKQLTEQNIQKQGANNTLLNRLPESSEPKRNDKQEMPATQHYEYDVALSFAGEDRLHAEALAQALFRRRVKVFYDKYEKNTLWGKDLYAHLSDLYQKKARYCVMFFSQHYVAKVWTKHELKAAQARALSENEEYILPIRLDKTEIPGILQTTAYLNWHEETPESVADAILEKLGKISHKPLIHERTVMDWLVDEVRMTHGKVSVDLGDIPGVKHSMRITQENEDWEWWYRTWFQQEFTERMGFKPTEESVRYALERYREIAEKSLSKQSLPVQKVLLTDPTLEPAEEIDPITFRLRNQEDGYRSWVNKHKTDGFIVVKDGPRWRVHHANCPSITGPIEKGQNLTTYPKICSTSFSKLKSEAEKNRGTILTTCACQQ